jgi:hypothetical protein
VREHLVLVDRDGILRRVFRAGASEAEIARAVEESLSMVPRP